MGIPILTYHSMRIDGAGYGSNDLVSLATDLDVIHASGFRVEPLAEIVSRLRSAPESLAQERIVGLSCDDGGDFDYLDIAHPAWGLQRSVLNTLRDAQARLGARMHVTSFAIISPRAREELDRSCMIGKGWWTDGWWKDAVASGVMHIANHSWDHNHDALPASFDHGVARGTFRTIANQRLADLEIRQAREFLSQHAPNPGDRLFAYPYGECNPFLVDEYFPTQGPAMGIDAAFADTPEPVTAASNPWRLPRYIHGRDWTTPDGLGRILAAAATA